MREKILLGIAVFALAGIMVPITADATHNETHKTKLLVDSTCHPKNIPTCSVFIDENNDGLCEESNLVPSKMRSNVAVILIEYGFVAFCGS